MAKAKGSTNPPDNRLEIYIPPDKHELMQELKAYAKERETSISALLLSAVEQDIYIAFDKPELIQKLKTYAALQGTSTTTIVLNLIEQWVRKEERTLKKKRRQ